MGTGYNALPLEVLLQILQDVPDLQCLDSILQASSSASRLFSTFGVKIIAAIVDKGALCSSIYDLIRLVALIRTSSWAEYVNSINNFRFQLIPPLFGYYDSGPVHYRWTEHHGTDDGHKRNSFGFRTTPDILRSLLVTHRQIMSHTWGVLNFYLTRFRQVRPRYPSDPSFEFNIYSHGVKPWLQYPASDPYHSLDFGPATWVEVQRVCQAYWQREVLERLREAVDRGSIPWQTDDVARLRTITAAELWIPSECGHQPRRRALHPILHPRPIISTTTQVLLTVAEFEDVWFKHVSPLPSPSYAIPDRSCDRDDAVVSRNKSEALEFADCYLLRGPRDVRPIRHMPFHPFQRLGFAIWETRRLGACGLINEVPTTKWLSPQEVSRAVCVWRSVLQPCEL